MLGSLDPDVIVQCNVQFKTYEIKFYISWLIISTCSLHVQCTWMLADWDFETECLAQQSSPFNRPRRPRGGVEVKLNSFFNLDAWWGWVANATPWSLYPWERPGTQCVGGWVGPRPVWTSVENLTPAEIRSWTIQPIMSCYTECALLAPLQKEGNLKWITNL
jgi:hypothetical protein